MSREHVGHQDIARFAEDAVNLPRDKANKYRAQARRLRERIEKYLSDHPNFTLKKMLLSGSLAKGTALRSLNDIDMACYIGGANAPDEIQSLLIYLVDRLREAFPNFNPDQVTPQTYSVRVSFRGTGLDVDVVSILYDDDPEWYGNLVSQDDGSFLKTNVPRHLEFIRKRKMACQNNQFAQVVRLAKYWVQNVKRNQDDFRFKSFMVEMILSYICDKGEMFSDYPESLQNFFTYIARTNLRDVIVFTDYCGQNAVSAPHGRVKIMDPVNPDNNVGRLYLDEHADAIVSAALDAGDAIDAALSAPSKTKSVYYWRKVFGPNFDI